MRCENVRWQEPNSKCLCCLLKEAGAIQRGEVTATEALRDCSCTPELIRKLTGVSTTMDEGALMQAIKRLYYDALLVKPVNLHKKIGEKLDPDDFKELLPQLEYKDFKKASCLTMKSLTAAQGVGDKIIYLVESTCIDRLGREYILKEIKKGEESDEFINELKASFIPDLYRFREATKEIKPRYPVILFPFTYFSYTLGGSTHLVSVMRKAEGKQLSQIITEVKNKTGGAREDLFNALNQLGLQLAHFYRFYMELSPGKILGPTVVHKDLHEQNIFFDILSNQITLIDNTTMGLQNNDAIGLDVSELFEGIASSGFTEHDLVALMKIFLRGFVAAFDDKTTSEQKKILQEIREQCKDLISKATQQELDYAIAALSTEISDNLALGDRLKKFAFDMAVLLTYSPS